MRRRCSSQDLLELNARAEAWLKENAPHVAGVNSSGPSALFAYIGQRNINAMLIGTVVVLLAISAILLFALRSTTAGFDQHRAQPASSRARLRRLGVDGWPRWGSRSPSWWP